MECVNQILFQLVCVCSVWIVGGGSCYKNDEYVCVVMVLFGGVIS